MIKHGGLLDGEGGSGKSQTLGKIKEAYDNNPEVGNLLLAPYFRDSVMNAQAGWRRVVGTAVANGIATPCLNSALTYFDGFRTARLPANLLQAQRDYFGAHTYERTDKPRGDHTTSFGGCWGAMVRKPQGHQ